MQVRFWGTRGSIPKCGPQILRYGGSTPCIEVLTDAGTLIVIDCGSGGHGLGQSLQGAGRGDRGHLLISHTHWDHIQGLPFFAPFFVPGNQWEIYAPRGVRQSLEETLAGQMQSTYFPVELEELGAKIHFHELVEGDLQIEEVRIATRYLNHPALTLGYRLAADGAVLVHASDHEPHARELGAGRGTVTGQDQRHAEFLANADLVIHDAQYTPTEFLAKVGWGHSTGEYAARLCATAGARRLALIHHDPKRTDDEIDLMVQAAAESLGATPALEVFGAAEGMTIELLGRTSILPRYTKPDSAKGRPAELLHRPVVIGAADPALAALLTDAIGTDGFEVHLAANSEAVVMLVAAIQPALVLVEDSVGAMDGQATCRAIRRLPAADPETLPVVLISPDANRGGPTDPGVTERLQAPFLKAFLQARARAWILRQACRWQRAPLPVDEDRRLQVLRGLRLLDTPAEDRFDRLTRLASAVFGVPMALVSLVDRDRQWFKSRHGLPASETHRDLSFCAHVVANGQVLVVPDTLLDARFAENPLVTGAPRIRFYAGYPLHVEKGVCVGTLCLLDTRPRELTTREHQLLRDLGQLVAQELKGGWALTGRNPAGVDVLRT
jgi:phosphoribosyl 1,2-cyclic phosphodiesterase/DNA-binding response OmpR family regulator